MPLRAFSTFTLDPAGRVLRKDGQAIKLHDQPLDVLIALTDRPGEVVSREELRRRLWPADTFVDYDNGLNNALSRLRDCLQDSDSGSRLIETVPRRGYRFVAPVTQFEPHALAPARARWRLASIAAAILFVTAVIGMVLVVRRPESSREGPRRLVVLPLQNLTGRTDLDHVVAGLGDELTTHLGRLAPGALAVIARTTAASYAAQRAPLPRLAAELDADHAIEGAVRFENARVHATIRLVRASDSTQVWAEMFSAPAAALPEFFDTVVTRTAGAVAVALNEDAAARARAATVSTAAFDAWLRGRHEWNRFSLDGFAASIEWHERALAIDARYSAAAVGLAQAWVFTGVFDAGRAVEAYANASRAVERALQLDPASADALAMRAMVRLFDGFDARGASDDFEAALARVPGDPLILHWAAAAASARGDHDRSAALARAARALDPRSVAVNADLGWYLYYARRFDEAQRQCALAAALDPSARGPQLCGEMTARARRARALVVQPYDAADRSALYRQAADRAALGDHGRALEAVREAIRLHASWPPFLAVDPAFDSLRLDPAFAGLLARTGAARGDAGR